LAHVLSLKDGTTTINFLEESGTAWCGLEDGGLIIENPDRKVSWTGGGIWRQGREVMSVAYDNRKIEISFEIGGATRTDIVDRKTAIIRILEKARESYQYDTAPVVYLQFQIDTLTSPVYFDVVDGELLMPEDFMSVEKLNWQKSGGKTIKGFTLKLECLPFARGDEVTIISNTSITNTDDALHTNYIDFAGSLIKGDVPGPVRIRFTSNTASPRMTRFYVGMRNRGNAQNWVHTLEAESLSIGSSGSISAKNTIYSGDTGDGLGGRAVSWNLTTTGNVMLLSKSFAATTFPERFEGKARVLVRGSFSPYCSYQVKMYYGVTPIREYPVKRHSYGHLDLGVVDVLPWAIRRGDYSSAWDMAIYCQPDSATLKTMVIDAIYLVPADDYKYRMWMYSGYDLQQNSAVEDNARFDQVHDMNGSYRTAIIEPSGLPIHATPNEDGKIIFVWESDTFSTGVSYQATVWAYHTPYYFDVRGSL